MKKGASVGSRNPKSNIRNAVPLQISEEDAGRLVGGIVEKGFSDDQQGRSFGPSTAPRPTVLPFPVARRRSHGPHWAPEVKKFNVFNGNDNDMDDGAVEEEDFDGMDLVSTVANPVQRKEKRGLDFSRWQEIVGNELSSVSREKKKERHMTLPEVGNKVVDKVGNLKIHHVEKSDMVSSFAAQKLVVREDENLESQIDSENRAQLAKMSVDEVAEAQSDILAKMNPELIKASKKQGQDKGGKQDAFVFAEQKFVGGEDGSLKSEIDSENCARLAKMSAEEIAEAQSEIMARLNPELIKTLKKRGQDKSRKLESSPSDNEKNMSSFKANPENSISDKVVNMVTGDPMKDENLSNVRPKNSIAWDAWSERVERVRDMRFSLDGNIIGSDFVHESDTGIGSSESGYNPNNVSERDFLRTEGDPGAVGYTIKEAVALTRSVVPGQRAFALHLIAVILDRAIHNICRHQVGSASTEGSVDWEAIWAFALGPEPELALSLRMSLDDNHNSVVLTCAKAICSVLSCDMNDMIFDISERTPTCVGDMCTAPVFRTKPDVNAGFLRGGFWKYNTKPSNILYFGEESVGDKTEDEHTIQDDVVVAGQDIAAGLVRMGILPRICYLMETDPSVPLEECLISILIAISRHSPTCAAAVMDCGKLVQTIASRFTSKEQLGINACKIKSVSLIKVLAQLEKKNCLTFIKNGILRRVTWHLFRHPFSIDQWVKSGKEACKLSSALLVEQLRLWKDFIWHGYCISDLPELFASLCIWLSVPEFGKLIDNNVLNEYCAITKEVYLLLDVLACRLPNFYSQTNEKMDNTAKDDGNWLWGQFGSIIYQALEWIASQPFNSQNKACVSWSLLDSEIASLLWVVSSVFNLLFAVLKAVIPEDTVNFPNGHLPWLPEFVPKIGLEIIKSGYLRFPEGSENGSVVKYLCDIWLKKGPELAIPSSCCLQGLFRVITSVDKLIQQANLDIRNPQFKHQHVSDKILADGMLKSCVVEVQDLLTTFRTVIANKWQSVQFVEMFGRGGPAPGVGVGWGASGGGYWSLNILLAQQDVLLLVSLLEIFEDFEIPAEDILEPGLTCALSACLIVIPGNSFVINKLLKFVFRVPVLKFLDFSIRPFLLKGYGSFGWKYTDEEFSLFANDLTAHFQNRWLSVKKKKEKESRLSNDRKKKETPALETIHEDLNLLKTIGGEEKSLFGHEWVRQRLPLPEHWFLSAISTNNINVSKAGLFFLLGIEAIPTSLASPVKQVPVVWKLHAMSVLLISGMDVLYDEKSRDVLKMLQNFYGEMVDEKGLSLQFESDIHENYSTFIEMMVEQFAAESYGDVLFGRQIAMYLQRSVRASTRVATWNALSNARALELLPPLPECFTKAEGYLEPIEDDERVLESYVKSWVSGALDKAATRNSMAFTVALHHLSTFIFRDDMQSVRSKLAKSLLRGYSRKQQHEGMMVKLVSYGNPGRTEIVRRLQMLKNVADGNATLVKNLESRIQTELNLN